MERREFIALLGMAAAAMPAGAQAEPAHRQDSIASRLVGTSQNRDIVLLTADELKYSNTATAVGATAEVLWKRIA